MEKFVFEEDIKSLRVDIYRDIISTIFGTSVHVQYDYEFQINGREVAKSRAVQALKELIKQIEGNE